VVLETGPWTHRPRLPLGEAYSGICHAPGGAVPSEDRQRELCNHGYARRACEHFPASCATDAVRFSVISEEPLRLVYILEKDYAPLEHGELDARLLLPDEILAAQARAFLASYGGQKTPEPPTGPCTYT
jgi:hypothetical protein